VSSEGEGDPEGGSRPSALAAIDAESTGWYTLVRLVRSLNLEERMEPGYYSDPIWSVRDVVGHLGSWLAEAQVQLERMAGGTYEGHDIDIDALNARLLEAIHGQPWDVTWTQANAAHTRLLQAWADLTSVDDEVAWWIRKSGPDHYGEHLERLTAWATELIGRRSTPTLDPERA
jgi:hypothetical protein